MIDQTPALEIRGLTRRFGRRIAVEDLDLTVRKGDVYGFLGRNGAGKTTTMRMLARLIRPSKGSIQVFGEDLYRNPIRAASRYGALVEIPAFYPYLSGRDSLILLAKLGGLDDPKGRADRTLEQIGLADRGKDKVGSYSQGMRQRLGIGQSMLSDPELVLLDEPTNGLDPQGIADVRALIQKLNREDGVTFFISSHLLSEIEMVCSRVAIIEQGKMVREGSVADLLAEASDGIIVEASPSETVKTAIEAWDSSLDVRAVGSDRWHLDIPVDRVDDMVRMLQAAGVKIQSVGPSPRTLESVFLSLVEGKQ